ncbi:reverse transcriptase [Phytophthora megakarya]|uniref:Reverse transcriptase n=1 Tax=Phytophthora megakarya TaxID=4795 RepID=A0A225W6U6_9STRA|nr:reverse transcriptase [Phytophthora megakarya]
MAYPTNVKGLRRFLGLATYLHKYADNYAGTITILLHLLKKEAAWSWTAGCQQAFDAVMLGLTEALISAVTDQDHYAVKTIDANRIDVARTYTPSSAAYAHDANAKRLIEFLFTPSVKERWKLTLRLRANAHRYRVHDSLLFTALLTAMRTALSCQMIITCAPGSCMSVMKSIQQDIRDTYTGTPVQIDTQERKYLRYMSAHEVCTSLTGSCSITADSIQVFESVLITFVFDFLRDSRRDTGIVVFLPLQQDKASRCCRSGDDLRTNGTSFSSTWCSSIMACPATLCRNAIRALRCVSG